jgi:hypothetical protein
MNARSDSAVRGRGSLPWLLFGALIAAGVFLAVTLGSQFTPLLEIARVSATP